MTGGEHKNLIHDLEERSFKFARDIRRYIGSLPVSLSKKEDAVQLIKSSGSVGANYIEANESLDKKEFLMRLRISREEAKESALLLRLLNDSGDGPSPEGERLYSEAIELKKIFSTIIETLKE